LGHGVEQMKVHDMFAV